MDCIMLKRIRRADLVSGVANKGNYTQQQIQETKQVSKMIDLSWVEEGRHLTTLCWIYAVAFWEGKGQKYRITK